MENQSGLESLVRVGTVTAVKSGSRMCRVYYPDRGYTSGWLKVLIAASGSDMWMPSINDPVLVLYQPTNNADGYVLGGL